MQGPGYHPHVTELLHRPQVEPLSAEWFRLRQDRERPITTGTQLHACLSDSAMLRLVKDQALKKPFGRDRAIEFGRRMEPVADWMYERIYGVPVLKLGFMEHETQIAVFPDGTTEFHEKVEGIGVSPDGVTPLNEPIEQKCVYSRLVGQEYLDAHPRSKGYKPPARYLHQLSGALEVLNCPYGYLCEWGFDEAPPNDIRVVNPEFKTSAAQTGYTGVVVCISLETKDPDFPDAPDKCHLYIYPETLQDEGETWEAAAQRVTAEHLAQHPEYVVRSIDRYRWWYRHHVRTKVLRFPQWWPRIVDGHHKLQALRRDPALTPEAITAKANVATQKTARTAMEALRARTLEARHKAVTAGTGERS
jgi:hypothetical protein